VRFNSAAKGGADNGADDDAVDDDTGTNEDYTDNGTLFAGVESGWKVHNFTDKGIEEWSCSASNARIFSETVTVSFKVEGWVRYIQL